MLAQNERYEHGSHVSGLDQFDKIVEIGQSAITRMKRSNVATYSEAWSEIKSVFAKTKTAKQAGLTAKYLQNILWKS